MVEQEVFAVIRRVDTDGDARLSYEEFADFFKTQANVQAPLMATGPNPNGYSSSVGASSKGGHQYRKKKKEYPGGDRGYLFATDSKLGANIERSINQSGIWRVEARLQQPMQVSPQQRQPIRKVHFTSPLRATSAAKSTKAIMSAASSNARRSTAFSSAATAAPRRFEGPIQQETEAGVVRMLNEQVSLDKSVEMAKNETVTRPDFNTHDAFRIFDIDNIGSVTALDI